MHAFKYYYKTMFRGYVLADDFNKAKQKLTEMEARFTRLEPSFFDSLILRAQLKVPEEERAGVYRALSSRLRSGQDIKKAVRSVIVTSQNIPVIYMCDLVLENLNKGKKIAQAFKLAGVPEQDLGHIENGEKSGTLGQAFNNLQERLYQSVKLKKQIKSDILKPLISLVAIWLLFYPAFSAFIPLIYDNVIEPNDTLEQLPPFYVNFILFCLYLRETQPYSMVLYYAFPFMIHGGLRVMGISWADVSTIAPPVKKYLVALDVLAATQILAQKTRSGVTVLNATQAAVPAMKTTSMRIGLEQFVKALNKGMSIGDAINETVLPVTLINEITNAGESTSFGDTLEEYVSLGEYVVKERGESMKLFANLVTLGVVAIGIIMLVTLTYIPVLKSTLQLAG